MRRGCWIRQSVSCRWSSIRCAPRISPSSSAAMTTRRPRGGRQDPLHHAASFQWGRGDATSPREDADPALIEKRRMQAHQAKELQTQMRQNQERRERERLLEERRREKEDADIAAYNPFGRGGGGAPLRNQEGDVVANLREATKDVLAERTQPGGAAGPGPTRHDLLERTQPGAGGPFMAPSYGQSHMTPRAVMEPPGVPSPTRRNGLGSMFGAGPEEAHERQARQRKYVSELEEQMRANQDRRRGPRPPPPCPRPLGPGHQGRSAQDLGAPTRHSTLPPPLLASCAQAAGGGGGGGHGGKAGGRLQRGGRGGPVL